MAPLRYPAAPPVLAAALALPLAGQHGATVEAAAAARAIAAGVLVADAGPNAFGHALPGLSAPDRRTFVIGNSFFKQNWVTAGASASARDGLGPLFNARSCSACHPHDGRSAPPAPDDVDRHGLLLRIGVRSAGGPDRPHPAYGTQIQDAAILGVRPEATVRIHASLATGEYGDGTPYELVVPGYELVDAGYGAPGPGAVLGPRTAPHLIGLGLLAAIPATALRTLADPHDRDGDGISGRVHVTGPDGALGRFGWKATQPTVRAQVAAAFVHDLGITSPDHAREPRSAAQAALVPAGDGSVEIDEAKLAAVVFYTAALAVPAPRDQTTSEVQTGGRLFAAFGCAGCHVPAWTTGDEAPHPAFRGQLIAPYTDLLLHDLGAGLADGKTDGDAQPAEWRTAPLWGVGLVPTVNGHSRYLHDGRARDLAEAILWHGGEAEAAKQRFRTAVAADRSALLAFVRSL